MRPEKLETGFTLLKLSIKSQNGNGPNVFILYSIFVVCIFFHLYIMTITPVLIERRKNGRRPGEIPP